MSFTTRWISYQQSFRFSVLSSIVFVMWPQNVKWLAPSIRFDLWRKSQTHILSLCLSLLHTRRTNRFHSTLTSDLFLFFRLLFKSSSCFYWWNLSVNYLKSFRFLIFGNNINIPRPQQSEGKHFFLFASVSKKRHTKHEAAIKLVAMRNDEENGFHFFCCCCWTYRFSIRRNSEKVLLSNIRGETNDTIRRRNLAKHELFVWKKKTEISRISYKKSVNHFVRLRHYSR